MPEPRSELTQLPSPAGIRESPSCVTVKAAAKASVEKKIPKRIRKTFVLREPFNLSLIQI